MSVVSMHCLSCDFCTDGIIDEFDSPEEARETMSKQGWTQVLVENGSLWDQCPLCSNRVDHRN